MKNDIYLGDCLELMNGIEDGSVDMILCDLPYGILDKGNKNVKWDNVIPMDRLWAHYERIIKPNGAIVLFAQGMFTARLMTSNEKMWRYNLVWKKGNFATGFLNANRMPLRNHEDVCVFYNKLPTYNPQMSISDKSHKRGSGGKREKDSCYGVKDNIIKGWSNLYYPRSVIDIAKRTDFHGQRHPTEKPVDLLRYLIRTYTDEGDLVLDNTCGSGSTCVAAILEHRQFIGIEKERKYYDIAVKRIEEAKAANLLTKC